MKSVNAVNLMISQPRYMPALNYIQRMSLCDVVAYLDSVQYTPRDWENRNKVKTADGWMWLSVPVVHVRRGQLIKDTRIDDSFNWRRKHIHSICQWYRKAPFFQRYFPQIERILGTRYNFLIDLNHAVLGFLLEEFQIECRFVLASELDVTGVGADLLVEICGRLGADTYVSGPLGRDYIADEKFRSAGIEIFYHDYIHPEYAQLFGGFQPYMSAIDILFNCGDDGYAVMSAGNVKKEEVRESSCSGGAPR